MIHWHATKDPLHAYCSIATDDDDLLDCFIHLPMTENVPFVLDYGRIAQAQGGDAHLMQSRQQHPNKFINNLLAPNTHIWCYLESPNQPWRIYLPDAILLWAIKWYHYTLSHIGCCCLADTMSMTFYNPSCEMP
jgi:hypothetical protein